VIGLLPPGVRDLYGLRWTAAHQRAWQATTAAVRASQRVVPNRIRLGDNEDLHRLVIRTEGAVSSRGRRTLELPVS
jgi:uncharacterized protein (DUF2236 family)